MSEALGGPAKPVHVLTTAELEENGGNFQLQGGPLIPIIDVTGTRKIIGENPSPVLGVTQAEIDANNYTVLGGPKVPVSVEGGGALTGVVAIRLAVTGL